MLPIWLLLLLFFFFARETKETRSMQIVFGQLKEVAICFEFRILL